MYKKNNWLRVLVLLTMMSVATAAQAQSSKDSLMKLVVSEVCDELVKKDFSGKTANDMQIEIGMVFMPVMMRHQEGLEAVYGGGVFNKETMEKVAQDIGFRLVTACPVFLKIMSGSDILKTEVPFTTTTANEPIKGVLLKVVPGEISHLLVKDAKGKTVKIWWMDYFDGSDAMADNPQRMVNKPVTVSFTEKEIYSAALKQYVKVKVATGIKF